MRYIVLSWGELPGIWISIHPDTWKRPKCTKLVELVPEAIAVFNASSAEQLAVQNQRARDFCDYLNMQEEAKEEALKKISMATAVAKRLGADE